MSRLLASSLLTLLLGCGDRSDPRSSADAPSPPAETKAPRSEKTPQTEAREAPQKGTRVVLLGTGTPNADPDRSGPAAAVIAGETAYLVDVGPGVVRRAAAAFQRGQRPLAVERLSRAFVTHLHSDHTAGYPDLVLTPWVLGRSEPLRVWGPPGLEAMTRHVLAAWEQDIALRLDGRQPSEDQGWQVAAQEVEPGDIYQDDNVKVTAFAVRHGDWEHAYGYRFDASDRSIVFSGDTAPSKAVVEACDGCDVLVHEVYAQAGFVGRPRSWQAYHETHHTSSLELAEIARLARPRLLVLTHQLRWGARRQQVLDDIRRRFDGEVAWGEDLDVY